MKKTCLLLLSLPAIILFYANARAAVVEYDLEIAWQKITINHKSGEGMTINGTIPGPTLYFTEGDTARIRVRNTMAVSTSIHWHGILVPPNMDGVPMITQPPIDPGATFTYEFPIRQNGTYWYHSHSGLQEQRGLYGSIVIAPKKGMGKTGQDRVVLLSDWTKDSPDYVLQTLKRGSEWYALEKGAAQSIFGAIRAGRLGGYSRRELQRMPPMDLADVAYDYFLANGLPETEITAKPGEKLRLRIINGSATTYFHLEFGGGEMTIISADGIDVEPLASQRFLIGVAETYDVLVTVPASGAYEFRATSHDGSAHTSIWIGSGERHPAPPVPRPDLYEAMQHAGLGALFSLTPAGTMGMSDMMVGMGMFDKPGMAAMHDMEHGVDQAMNSHAAMAMEEMGQEQADPAMKGHILKGSEQAKTESSGGMMADRMREHEPAGGRSFGRRFGLLAADISSRGQLATDGGPARPWPLYRQLRSPVSTALPAGRAVREVRLTLDGDMERYAWLLNNKPLSESDHILIREGEVVRFIMINRTMMHHPMHLHGHFFRVVNGQGDHAPLKHTVDVVPMSTTVIEFYGNEVGDWFFHCHLLYHMKAGMARLVHYQDFEPSPAVKSVRSGLYKDHWYYSGVAEVLSNMTEGELSFANTRVMVDMSWEVGWEKVAEEEWEFIGRLGWYVNRFTSFFAGGRSEGVRSREHGSVGILGLSYLLPLNIKTRVWVDSEGESRVIFAKEFELTPRLALHGETEYDSLEHWEGAVGLQYMLTRHLSLAAKWHSEYGFGGGVQGSF